MTNDNNFLPCISRCESKHELAKLQPKYDLVVKEKDALIVEMENLTKVVNEDLQVSSPEVRKIITQKTELKNNSYVLKLENKKLVESIDCKDIEIDKLRQMLKDKSEEVVNFKDLYEKDEELQLVNKELEDTQHTIKKLTYNKVKLEKVKDKLKGAIKNLEAEYNALVETYNKIFDKYKERKKELGTLNRQINIMKRTYAKYSLIRYIKNLFNRFVKKKAKGVKK